MGGMAAGEVSDKKTFWHEDRKLGTEGTHKINSGTIEWPFEFQLDPSMPESIEGMNSTYIVYDLHASISRPGWNAKDITAHSHIRIVRTLGPEQMETTRSRVCYTPHQGSCFHRGQYTDRLAHRLTRTSGRTS